MVIRWGVCLALSLVGCLNSRPREVVVEGDPARFPLSFVPDFITDIGIPVIATEDRQGKARRFAVDTGSAITSFTTDYAKSMAVPWKCGVPYWVTDGSGYSRRVDGLVRVEHLGFRNAEDGSGISFHGFDALVVDAMLLDANDLAGVLGMPLFEDYTFAIDYAAGALFVSTARLEPSAPNTVSFQMRKGVVHVPITIDGKEFWALLDTGWSSTLSVPRTKLDALRVDRSAAPSAEFAPWIVGRLSGAVSIGGLEIDRPFISSTFDRFVVGSGLFEGMVLTVDQRSMLLRLARSESTESLMSDVRARPLER